MPTHKDLIEPSLLKLERAKHHIDDLSKQIDVFLAQRPFKFVVSLSPSSDNPRLDKVGFRIKEEKPIPSIFSIIIGDAVHNLRSALDILMYGLLSDKAAKPDKIQFPFAKSDKPEALEGTINNFQINVADDKVKDVIRSLKPYPGGNYALFHLNDLWNKDKHRLLLLTATSVIHSREEWIRIHPLFSTLPNLNILAIGQKGGMIFGIPKNSLFLPRETETVVQPKFAICLAPDSPLSGHPIVPALKQMSAEVHKAVIAIADAACLETP